MSDRASSHQPQLPSQSGPDAQPRPDSGPQGASDRRASNDPRGDRDPQGAGHPRSASDHQAAGDPRSASIPRQASDPWGACDPQAADDPQGASSTQPASHPQPERRRWMSVLARADADAIATLLAECGKPPNHTVLRGPEGGLVMLRGRAGGGGAAFNLGEMTVTRCSVRIGTGQIGHAYVAGRDARQAELAALVDAMMQDPDRIEEMAARVITPLQHGQATRRAARARQAATTQVQFFAMQTMRT